MNSAHIRTEEFANETQNAHRKSTVLLNVDANFRKEREKKGKKRGRETEGFGGGGGCRDLQCAKYWADSDR